MLRLHNHSSRSYPGRPARFAPSSGVVPVMATCRGTGQESAEAIVGVGSCHKAAWQLETSPVKRKEQGGLIPLKGQTPSRESVLMGPSRDEPERGSGIGCAVRGTDSQG